jgi:hypothetical protein
VARVERRGGRRRVVAESPEELALLRHGERMGGELVLLEACYPVHGDVLVLPDTISPHGARRVREALEQAASSHREAEQRRKRFRLVQE